MTVYINLKTQSNLVTVIMLLKSVVIFCLSIGSNDGGEIYDSFSGMLATEELLTRYTDLGVLE